MGGKRTRERFLIGRRQVLAGAAGFGLTSCLGVGQAFAMHPFKFGVTPVFLDSDLEVMSHLTEYSSGKLKHPVSLLKRRTYQEISSLLLSGEVQAAWICGFSYAQHRERLSLLAMPLYKGKPLYQAYLIVNNDSPAQNFEDLSGHIHAFSDPNSDAGYLETLYLLAERQIVPGDFFSQMIYTNSHRNVIRAVSSGLAQSGSVSGYVWDIVAKYEPELVAGTRVIRKSEPLGFPPIVCNRDARNAPHLVALIDALLEMADDPLGKHILDTLHLDGFVPGDPSNYDLIAEKMRAVREFL